MVESDAGAGEGVLDGGGDPVGVAVGGDGDGAPVSGLGEGGADVLGDRVGVGSLGDAAVLDVPPDRRLRRRALGHRRRRLGPAIAAAALLLPSH